MATPLTEAATFDPQVIVPQDGLDDETAASLVPALQSVANRTRALKPVYDFANGDAAITTPTTKTLTLNGTVIDSPTDGGDVHLAGAVRGRHWVSSPDCSSSGTKVIPYYAEHVYPGGFGSPVGTGVIWQVETPPSGSADRQWVMKLVNPQSNAIIIKDVAGNTIATIVNSSGSIRGATIAYDGSWDVIDYAWRP